MSSAPAASPTKRKSGEAAGTEVGGDDASATTTARLQLSQDNVDAILALPSCDQPKRYIPSFVPGAGAGDRFPTGDPVALLRHADDLCRARWATFGEFQAWVRAEREAKGVVEVGYDHGAFEREELMRSLAEDRARFLAKIARTAEEGEFGEWAPAYDQATGELVMKQVEEEEGSSKLVPVYDEDKEKYVMKCKS